MANKQLLTYASKIAQVEQFYYSPVSVVPPQLDFPIGTIYCFLAKVDAWSDDNDPVQPTQDQRSIKNIFKNIFVAKKINTTEISPVIAREDWTANTVYDFYRDDIDMLAKDINNSLVKKFYVKNKYDQVFKCLWNNNNQPTTVEPFFEPGAYNNLNVYIGADGYKWKYVYTIDAYNKVHFMDPKWMPVPVGFNTPSPLTPAGRGSIDVAGLVSGGQNYNTYTTVSITGDGTGATGVAIIDGGVVTDVRIDNAGKDYTYADISITSLYGSGATANVYPSPIGGHGFDPISELGCSHVMISVEFDGEENGYIPVSSDTQTFDFHQLGIVINPTTSQRSPFQANGAIYKTTTDVTVAAGYGSYTNDESVSQVDQFGKTTFTATVLDFNTNTNLIRLINTEGTITKNIPIRGTNSGTSRTLLDYNPPDFTLYSGYISFIENRTGVTRSADGIEQFKFVLGY